MASYMLCAPTCVKFLSEFGGISLECCTHVTVRPVKPCSLSVTPHRRRLSLSHPSCHVQDQSKKSVLAVELVTNTYETQFFISTRDATGRTGVVSVPTQLVV